MRVRPVELAGLVDRHPVEDAEVQPLRRPRAHPRSDQVPAADAVDDRAELVVLRRRAHLGPARVGGRGRRLRRAVGLPQGPGDAAALLEQPLLPVEEGVVQRARMLLCQLVPEVVVLRELRDDLLLKRPPAPHRLLRKPLVEGRRLPPADVRGDRDDLDLRRPQHVNVRMVALLLLRLRLEELLVAPARHAVLARPLRQPLQH
mmetsp:Transcript_90849/g.257338  ORF Transcript_90849/g.257338 Transcript_90849/m.257338 type:complete len:203 (+) Transcript_90849:379-987(+)